MDSPARPIPLEEPDDDLELDDFDGSQQGVVVHTNDIDDFDEATGLMTHSSLHTMEDEFELEDRAYSGSFRKLVFLMILALIISSLAVIIPETGSMWWLKAPARIPLQYSCPAVATTTTTTTTTNESSSLSGTNISQAISKNATDFLEQYQLQSFDKWDKSYEELKQAMYDFKTEFFPKYLVDDGNIIYESSCGIGLSLYMTLEILKESSGIENLIVYGSDHTPNGVEIANAVMDELAPAHAQKGMICNGEATDLSFVPSNSFDLVFTAYISPQRDPLHFEKNGSAPDDIYQSVCNSDEDDWKGQKLNELAQEAQEEWYGQWVNEMARIAKPGTPVIVEQVSKPLCDAIFDWGGVGKEWWTTSAQNNTYHWDIDSESIVIRDDTLFRERYHVFMLKNGRRLE